MDKSWLLESLEEWLECELGQSILACEQALLDERLSCLFGYHLLQLSVSRRLRLFDESAIRHKVQLSPLPACEGVGVQALPEALPLEGDSVDVALLHHVLEYSDNPHQLLREASRVLVPRGHLLISGFNPWSLMGLRSRVARPFGRAPYQSRLLSSRRVVDWLGLLGFAVEDVRYTFFRVPVNRSSLLRRFERVERIGQRYSLPVGCVYQIHACKQVVPVIPIKQHWERRRAALGVVPLAKPSTRNTTLH